MEVGADDFSRPTGGPRNETGKLSIDSIQNRSSRITPARLTAVCGMNARMFHVEQFLLAEGEPRNRLIPRLLLRFCKVNRASQQARWCSSLQPAKCQSDLL